MKKTKRNPRGAGRPVTTGSNATTPIHYRVSAADRVLLERAAAPATANEFARAAAIEKAKRILDGRA
jgi:uncharacterized protein (DUF1778 family)